MPTNEWEFQGEALKWLNEEIASRPGLGLEKATQEPSKITRHRSDLVVWFNRAAESGFLSLEIKTPSTPITNLSLFRDAQAKAKRWKTAYFALWNMQSAELYRTPEGTRVITPGDAIKRWPAEAGVTSVEDWMRPNIAPRLRRRAVELLDAAWADYHLAPTSIPIDSSLFVERLAERIRHLRLQLEPALAAAQAGSRVLRHKLVSMAAAEGYLGFVSDLPGAVAGQYAYRLVGQVLFYFALRRKQPALPKLELPANARIPDALRPFWDAVRRFDYEALFKPGEIDSLVTVPPAGQKIIRSLIDDLTHYNWEDVHDDVLGAVFERLIPEDQQSLLGQFYTPVSVADLLTAFTVDGNASAVLDPGCGSGTFLLRTYDFLKSRTGQDHPTLLSKIWGFDISPFATELAAINLFRQNMTDSAA